MRIKFTASTDTSSIVSQAMHSIDYVNHNIQWEDGSHTGCILTLEVGTDVKVIYVLVSVTESEFSGTYYAVEVNNKLLFLGSRENTICALNVYIKDLCDYWF